MTLVCQFFISVGSARYYTKSQNEVSERATGTYFGEIEVLVRLRAGSALLHTLIAHLLYPKIVAHLCFKALPETAKTPSIIESIRHPALAFTH